MRQSEILKLSIWYCIKFECFTIWTAIADLMFDGSILRKINLKRCRLISRNYYGENIISYFANCF
jgi:hypothetical protein